MTQQEHYRGELQSEDAQRIRRLSEEVRSRLLEIALILAHTVKMEFRDGAVIRFVPRKMGTSAANAGAGDWLEIIDVAGVEACYGVIGGQPFAESPCGA